MREIAATWMRGGTSKCWVFRRDDLQVPDLSVDEVLLRIYGSPDHRQVDGVGGGTSTTSKAVILAPSATTGWMWSTRSPRSASRRPRSTGEATAATAPRWSPRSRSARDGCRPARRDRGAGPQHQHRPADRAARADPRTACSTRLPPRPSRAFPSPALRCGWVSSTRRAGAPDGSSRRAIGDVLLEVRGRGDRHARRRGRSGRRVQRRRLRGARRRGHRRARPGARAPGPPRRRTPRGGGPDGARRRPGAVARAVPKLAMVSADPRARRAPT